MIANTASHVKTRCRSQAEEKGGGLTRPCHVAPATAKREPESLLQNPAEEAPRRGTDWKSNCTIFDLNKPRFCAVESEAVGPGDPRGRSELKTGFVSRRMQVRRPQRWQLDHLPRHPLWLMPIGSAAQRPLSGDFAVSRVWRCQPFQKAK